MPLGRVPKQLGPGETIHVYSDGEPGPGGAVGNKKVIKNDDPVTKTNDRHFSVSSLKTVKTKMNQQGEVTDQYGTPISKLRQKYDMERAPAIEVKENKMVGFKQWLEEGRGFIKGGGLDAERHYNTYVRPHIGSNEFTHILGKAHSRLTPGSKVKFLPIQPERDNRGIVNVHCQDEQGNNYLIPVSKFFKPGPEKVNKGTKYESDFIDVLKKDNMMPQDIQGAGNTDGTDFVLINRKTKSTNKGRVIGSEDKLLNGETKNGVTAAMGQLTLVWDENSKWHFTAEAMNRRPLYAKAIIDSGIVKYLNKVCPDPFAAETTASGRAKSIYLPSENLDPAIAYLKDHHVDVLQIGDGFGTYKVNDQDVTGCGLPKLSGKGKWTIREKQSGNKTSRTVVFQPAGKGALVKSHFNLDNENDRKTMKKALGLD